jgi:peptidyl-prolyl cis-trans isomerase C
MKRGSRGMRLAAVTVMVIVCAIVSLVLAANPEKPAESKVSAGPGEQVAKPEAVKLTGTTPLVSFGGKTYTVDNIKDMLKYERISAFMGMGLTPDMLTSMSRAQLERPLTELFTNHALYDEAMKAGFKPEKRTLDGLKQYEDRVLTSVLYQKEIADKVPEATEAEAKAEYEKEKDKFKTDFSFQVKQIVFYTYKKYTVQKGDTLESIAKKVSESEKAAANIRDAATKEELWVPPAERDKKPFRPIHEGQELLVPMPPNQQQAVNEKMLDVLGELQAGANFDELAKKYSEGPNPGQPLPRITPAKDEKPPLPEIVSAVKETPIGKYSDVIKTKHGFQILFVVDKTEESVRPFDSIKAPLIRQLTQMNRVKAGDEYLEKLLFNPKYATLHPEVFTDAKATSSSVVAEIGDLKLTLADVERSLGEDLSKAETPKDKLKLLIRDRQVISALIPLKAREAGLEKDPEFVKQMEARRLMAIGYDYLQSEVDKRIKVTDADMLKYYQEHIKDYTTPRMYKISQILKKISDNLSTMPEAEKQQKIGELTKMLNEVRAKIKTKEDFAKVAQEISDDPSTKDKGGELPTEISDAYKRGFDGRLEKMKVDEVSEPFVYGAFVYLIRVNEMKPERVNPFSEVKGRVEADMRRNQRREVSDEIKKKALDDAKFKILI